jgi:hypothetical protein
MRYHSTVKYELLFDAERDREGMYRLEKVGYLSKVLG